MIKQGFCQDSEAATTNNDTIKIAIFLLTNSTQFVTSPKNKEDQDESYVENTIFYLLP